MSTLCSPVERAPRTNAELVKLGLARPAVDSRALKYLDLFHELDSLTAAGPAK